MIKKGQLVKFSRPVSSMKTVYFSILNGHNSRREIMEDSGLNENQVRSACWNLSFVGAIIRLNDSEGRTRYEIPGGWQPTAPCLRGVSSIFNAR
jgi:hypothetical protein